MADTKTRRHPSKACNECKQQKLRCSAQVDYPEPCARCKKLELDCKVEDGFRRVSKRLRAESLQLENEALRQRLESGQASPAPSTELPRFAAMPNLPIPNMPATPAYTIPDREPPGQVPHPGPAAGCSAEALSQPSHRRAPPTVLLPTLARTIGGIRVEASEIDDIFAIYFNHYSQHLPVLDPDTPPNKYFEDSPLLFWAIIGVGARRYSGNPTLLGSIADHILHLDWPPLHITPAIVPAIKGLLLLSSFPLPTDSTFKDITYTLSGSAVNLGLQIGLHAPLHRQEFSRGEVRYTEGAIGRRVRLWFHCIVVHQKAACGLGYPITVSMDRLKKQMDLQGLSHLIPSSLSFEMRLGSLISRMNPLFSPASSVGNEEHSKFARSMIADAFEAELDELEGNRIASEDMDSLHLNIARLQLRVYYLRDCESLASGTMAKLGVSATTVIALVEKVDDQSQLMLYCPHYVFRMTALAGSVLLRMLKAMQQLSGREEAVAGYKSYLFKAISLLKKMSVEENDGPSRMARIFSRLWTSEQAFKHDVTTPGGSANTAFGLLVQSRLSMSILHDTTWWYRRMYGFISGGGSGGQQSRERSSEENTRLEKDDEANPTTVSSDPVLAASGPDSFVFTPLMWGGQFDPGFESMIDAFPETWPL